MSSASRSRRQSIRPSVGNASNPLETDAEIVKKLEKIDKLNWWADIGLGTELIALATPIVSNFGTHNFFY